MRYKNRFRDSPRSIDLSELDLARHEVADHLSQWFARSRLDYLLWFPFRLVDALAGLIVTILFIGVANLAGHIALATAFAGLILWRTILLYQLDHDPVPNFHRALRRYIPFSIIRAITHAVIATLGVLYLPQAALLPLLVLYCFVLRSSATGFLTLAHIAAGNILLMAVPMIGALYWRGGIEQSLTALMMVAFAGYAISAIYNQYYMFATRRLRTKTMQETNETVQMLLDQFAEQSHETIWQTDREGLLVDSPGKLAEIVDVDPEALRRLQISKWMIDSPEARKIIKLVTLLRDFQNLPCPFLIKGKTRWISLSGRPQFDRDGSFTGYRGFATDISARREAEDRAAFLAHYDPLTELPNRELFTQTLDRLLQYRRGDQIIAVMYVDLNHFKDVNDSYGHPVGNAVLRETARRLKTLIGDDNMVGRLNGDEFAVILADPDDAREAVAIADEVVRLMDQEVEVEGVSIAVSASVGLTFAPQDGETSDALLQSADIALHDAKARGRRSRSLFKQEMQKSLQDRRSLEADLRKALAEGALNLHYQPQVDVKTGKTSGYEALLRWSHPERGDISPERFIAIAEDCDLIVPLGEWVIREALSEAANWPQDISLAVNLSPLQLRSERLLPTIVHALSQSGVDASQLEIEITESVLLEHSSDNLAKLHRLHDLGIRIALDDFGTGFSSLNYLRSFPFDKIKIDRCFIQDMVDNPDNRAIVEAVLSLADDLNMVTTAEGVETKEQLKILRAKGCRQVQGYLFSRPKPAEELGYERYQVSPANKPVAITPGRKSDAKKSARKQKISHYRGQPIKSAG